MSTAGGRLVYRPTLTRVLAVCYLAFGLWWLVAILLGPQPRTAVAAGSWLFAVGVLVYGVFWRPAVAVDGEGVELINVVRTVRVPWSELEAVDTRYALTLHAGGRRYTGWAASAPGRTASTLAGFRDRARGRLPHGLPDPRWLPGATGTDRASRDLRSDSGAAAFMVEQGWAGWRDRSAQLRSESAGVAVRWSRPLVAVAVTSWIGVALVGWLG